MGAVTIDWDKFRVGTVVGSKMDGRFYEITAMHFFEEQVSGYAQSLTQRIELELGPGMTTSAAWWIPNYFTAGMAVRYLKFESRAYKLDSYEYDVPRMVITAGLTRAAWADQVALSPFDRIVKNFRQSLTSSQ